MSETPKEGNEGSGTAKDFTTKAEYNRALVRQENWASAEEMRTATSVNQSTVYDPFAPVVKTDWAKME
jgi:hypothetical protein